MLSSVLWILGPILESLVVVRAVRGNFLKEYKLFYSYIIWVFCGICLSSQSIIAGPQATLTFTGTASFLVSWLVAPWFGRFTKSPWRTIQARPGWPEAYCSSFLLLRCQESRYTRRTTQNGFPVRRPWKRNASLELVLIPHPLSSQTHRCFPVREAEIVGQVTAIATRIADLDPGDRPSKSGTQLSKRF